MKYSPTINGFYASDHLEKNLPIDAFEISDELYFSLLDAQEAGKQIIAVNGMPVAISKQQPIITQISPRQIRMALTQMNLRSQVETAVAAGDQNLKDWYEFSTYFDRNHLQVIAMAQALNVTNAQLDLLWALAATL